jgi:hypothetical protein
MNSDFMQAEAEQLAKRVAAEPDNRSRIKKAYMLVYGRDPSEQEIKLGIEYLHAEPMREFEENKNKPVEGAPGGGRGGRGGGGGLPSVVTDAAKPMPDGGMGGFAGGFGGGAGGRRGAGPAVPTTVKYDPSAWGRYAKVLFSSSEFLFIN